MLNELYPVTRCFSKAASPRVCNLRYMIQCIALSGGHLRCVSVYAKKLCKMKKHYQMKKFRSD